MEKKDKQMKKCNKCKELKPLSKFTRNKRMEDGLHNYCKACSQSYLNKRKDDYQKMLKQFHPELFNK